MEHHYRIEYEGIILRPLEHGDIESLRVWRNDAENSRFIRKIPPITPEAQEEWFVADSQDEGTLTFAICVDSKLVGSVALYNIDERSAEFGHLMIGAAKGRGVGCRATLAMLWLSFNTLHLNDIFAEVSVDNIAAIIIYVRVGFCVMGQKYNPLAKRDEFKLHLDQKRFSQLYGTGATRKEVLV